MGKSEKRNNSIEFLLIPRLAVHHGIHRTTSKNSCSDILQITEQFRRKRRQVGTSIHKLTVADKISFTNTT